VAGEQLSEPSTLRELRELLLALALFLLAPLRLLLGLDLVAFALLGFGLGALLGLDLVAFALLGFGLRALLRLDLRPLAPLFLFLRTLLLELLALLLGRATLAPAQRGVAGGEGHCLGSLDPGQRLVGRTLSLVLGLARLLLGGEARLHLGGPLGRRGARGVLCLEAGLLLGGCPGGFLGLAACLLLCLAPRLRFC